MLYGEEFVVYNVHSLVHLAAETEVYGSLDACSAFEFENYMQQLKKMVRSGNNPIVQIAKRLGELSLSKIGEPEEKNVISVKKANEVYVLNEHSCCEVIETTIVQTERHFTCRAYKTTALYHSPCDSRLVGVYKANAEQTTIKVLTSGQKSDHVSPWTK
ncbi:Hypothetical predicted protein [Paramuricea clavata]|uniref:Uncharacterized protein n=1 Tax=Paramuricea clavata TaxID=317549 RepID=A0A6S7HMR2_PARCT|nr:Hypothetical predicted protein [Paramuricea clavata]